MLIYIYFLIFIFGLVFGSFGNAWAWRIVHKESITKGRSHCAVCNHELTPKDLVPIFSYIFLKGKCRYCGSKISPRYFIAELLLGTYFLSISLVYGFSVDCLRIIILGFLLFVLSLVDYDTMEIPNGLIIAAAVTALLKLPEWKGILIGGLSVSVPLLILVLIMDKILKKESMGGGDIKLIAMLGMHFGVAQTVFLIFIASLIGIVFAKITNKKEKAFPFGPILSVAAWITALIGSQFITWYISLI